MPILHPSITDLRRQIYPVDNINVGLRAYNSDRNFSNYINPKFGEPTFYITSARNPGIWITLDTYSAINNLETNKSTFSIDGKPDYHRDLKDYRIRIIKNGTTIVYDSGVISGYDNLYRSAYGVPTSTYPIRQGMYALEISPSQLKAFGSGKFCISILANQDVRKDTAGYPIAYSSRISSTQIYLPPCFNLVNSIPPLNIQTPGIGTIPSTGSGTGGSGQAQLPGGGGIGGGGTGGSGTGGPGSSGSGGLSGTSSGSGTTATPSTGDGTTIGNISGSPEKAGATNIWRYIDLTGKQIKDLLAFPNLPNNSNTKSIPLFDIPKGGVLLNYQMQIINDAGIDPACKPNHFGQLNIDYSKDPVLKNSLMEKNIQLTSKDDMYATALGKPSPSYGLYNNSPINALDSNLDPLSQKLIYTVEKDPTGVGTIPTCIPDDFRVRILFNYIFPNKDCLPNKIQTVLPANAGVNNILNTNIPTQTYPHFKWYRKTLTGLEFKALPAFSGSNSGTAKSSIISNLKTNEYLNNAAAYVVKKDSSSFNPLGSLSYAKDSGAATSMGSDSFKAYTGSLDTLFEAFKTSTGRDLPLTSYDINTKVESRPNQLILNISQDTGGTGLISSISDDMEIEIFYSVSIP